MRRAVLPALLALVLLCVSVAAADHDAGEIVLFDLPRGGWLGALRNDAPLVVLEERDGWRHVRLEGWIIGASPGRAGSGPTAAPEPGSTRTRTIAPGDDTTAAVPGGTAQTAAREAIVQGVLAPPMGAGGSAGAGVLVLLVQDDKNLDEEHRKTGEACRARLDQKDRDLEALRAEVNRALNSSDNFREASGRNDDAKTRLIRGQRERRDLLQECRVRAQAIFQGSGVQRAISDGSGRFEFQGVGPGRYRVVAFETTGDAPRSWSFAFVFEGRGTRVLDPDADRSPLPADWGLR